MLKNYDRYNLLLIWLFMALLLASGVMIVLNLSLRPHVRQVIIVGGDSQASIVDPQITINFSNPMQRVSVEEALSITPAVEGKLRFSWSNNTLQVKLPVNLQLDTEYELKIGGTAEDIYGTQLENSLEYRFHTLQPQFTYLEPNRRQGRPDRLVDYNLVTKASKEIFVADSIELYARNRRYVVISSLTPQKLSQLWLIDQTTGEKRQLPLPITDLRISKVLFSPQADQIAFAAQSVMISQGIAVPQTGNKIYVYDILTGQYRDFGPDNVLDIAYAPDGTSILFRGDDAIYYILDLASGEMIDLGQHFATGGFNRSRDKIAFVDYDPVTYGGDYPFINIYDNNRQNSSITKGESFVLDPVFFSNSEAMVFGEKVAELEGSKGVFGIQFLDANLRRQETLRMDGFSLELPRLSYDDRYVLIEKYNLTELADYNDMRNYVFQTKPYSGKLVVYDRQEREWLDIEITGIEGIWWY